MFLIVCKRFTSMASLAFVLLVLTMCQIDEATSNTPDMGEDELDISKNLPRPDGAVQLTTPLVGISDQNPAFSPDGSQLVFTRFDEGYNDGPAGLFLLDLTTFTVSRLTTFEDQDNVNLPGSAWNATTNRIVLASDRMEADDLWRIAPDGSDFSRLTTHTNLGVYLEPSWSPDGQWLVFEISLPGASEDGRIGKIWKIQADGSDLTPLTSNTQFDDRQPNWSPAGDQILFQRRSLPNGDWDIYTIIADGSGLFNVTNAPNASDTDASWSPNSQQIVYSSDLGGLPAANIFTISANGGNPIRITTSTNEDSAPSWSPDGRWIAFESHIVDKNQEGSASLWRIGSSTSSTYLPFIITPTSSQTTVAIPLSEVNLWPYRSEAASD